MQRIIVRHLTGAKAGTVEWFHADSAREIILSQEPGATVRFDPRVEVVVSHQYARRVTRQILVVWVELAERSGRPGAALNRRSLRGRVALRPGDRVRLGPGGPDVEFDVDGGPGPP